MLAYYLHNPGENPIHNFCRCCNDSTIYRIWVLVCFTAFALFKINTLDWNQIVYNWDSLVYQKSVYKKTCSQFPFSVVITEHRHKNNKRITVLLWLIWLWCFFPFDLNSKFNPWKMRAYCTTVESACLCNNESKKNL